MAKNADQRFESVPMNDCSVHNDFIEVMDEENDNTNVPDAITDGDDGEEGRAIHDFS